MNFDDASLALVELATSRHNAFHTSEAAAINISPQRLRRAKARGEIYLLHPKVWAISGMPISSAQALRAATRSIPDSAASLVSAAWLHGWVDNPPRIPHVWHPAGKDRRRNKIWVHERKRIDPTRDITSVDQIETLNKAATLCLLGIAADKLLVEKCLDEFLRTESEAWLTRTMTRLYSDLCPGTRCLAGILADPRRLDGVPDSWLERVTAKLVGSACIPPVILQHPVTVEGRQFRLDLACPELQLGVETHSRRFHWGPGNEDADNTRDILLSSAGWQILYVTYSQLINPDELVRLFTLTARARAEQLQVRLGSDLTGVAR